MNSISYLGLDVPLDSAETWQYLSQARNLKGLFQLETSSAALVLKKIKPKSVDDLSLCNALNRPGAMKFTDDIAAIRDGIKPPQYLDMALEPFLKDTYGSLIYQESVMKIAQQLAGFDAKSSNVLLKALGKKDEKKMASIKGAFIDGMLKNKFSKEVSEKLFSWFEAFANYSFNKSHSVSYSLMGYVSAYIKLHYPLQFFCSLLNYTQYEQKPIEEIAECVWELPEFAIPILPPTIDKIDNKFTIEDGSIRYPVGLIKSIGEAIFLKLKSLSSSQTATLDSFLEAVIGAGLNSRSVESMIISGALNKFGMPREEILFYYWFLTELNEDILERFWIFKSGEAFSRELIFKFLEHTEAAPNPQGELFNEFKSSGKLRVKSYFKTETTRLNTLNKIKEYVVLIDQYKAAPKLAYFFWETHSLGFAFDYKLTEALKLYKEIEQMHENHTGKTVGFVEDFRVRKSAKGNTYGLIKLRLDGRLEAMLFSEICEGAKDLIKIGDFVSFSFCKLENKLKIDEIKVINKHREKYEFYNKPQAENKKKKVE